MAEEVRPAVACKNIEKTYLTGKITTRALRGVDISIGKGELFMLVGPSGCGKTTLISIIAGILNQDAGDVELFGTHLNSLTDEARTEFRGKHVGFVFQAFNLIPTLTTVENIAIPLLLTGSPRSRAYRRARELLDLVGLETKMQAYPANLSGGQQQRVAIARALVHDPKLVVCDEPTSALDHETGTEIMELFRAQKSTSDATFVIVTHDQRIYSYADRMAAMDDGKIMRVGRPSEMNELSGH